VAARASANGASLSSWDLHSVAEWHRKDRADDSAREDGPSNNLGVLRPSAT